MSYVYIAAFNIAVIVYIISIFIHVSVIKKTISYKNVNGGRSESYEVQKKQSISSIVILNILLIYVAVSFFVPNYQSTSMYLVMSVILVLFWLLGTVMQLLGTTFEKKVIVWINLFGLLSHIGLLLLYFTY